MARASLIGWFVATIAAVGSVEAAGWRAGAARVEITPKGPVWMSGYAARKSPSEGVDHPIFAKALALRDEQDTTLLWITADVIGFDREFTNRVVDRIKDAHGLPRAAVALFASHTHTGPTLKMREAMLRERGIDPESKSARNNADFRLDLEEAIFKLAGEAIGKLAPAEVAFGVGKAGFAMNRREKTANGFKIGLNPDGPTDKSVPVLRVNDADGKTLAVAFGYACHNTTLTDKAMRLSGDYAGFAQSRIEAEHPGAVTLFLTGCAGDANPEPRGTMDQAKTHGRELAEAVEATLSGSLTTLDGSLRAAFAEPTIRFAGPTDRASYETRRDEPGENRRAHARRLLEAIDAGRPIRSEYPYPMHAFALGDRLTMVALAGEVVVDYAIRLRKELGDSGGFLWMAAYADDVFGYVGSARVIREGGYEGLESYYYTEFPTPLSEGVEETIVAKARDLVSEVRKR